ncbi:hypothetical protein PVAND_016600 [Polypedilum vanderplanki]|uniref:Cathepsin propeptide inhibitor domain-containing protein n=1 Tax=Polypedilum vanderplanki TaxID=319348 RepID=A0A9J6BFL0_POLVA|nr:hypothetical protein PVAND_016600 [Polypedilum vanderplanki]
MMKIFRLKSDSIGKSFSLTIFVILSPILVFSYEQCRYWEFIQFRYNNNIVYPNASVEFYRCRVFTANIEMIERHNHLFRQGRYSYSLAINQFADQTNEEFIATNTGILPVVDNSTTTTTTQKPASHEHHENHHRHKRAAATWSVPSTFKPGNLDLRKAGIPV